MRRLDRKRLRANTRRRSSAGGDRDRIERPRELRGATWQIPFDGQNLYVTVNHDGKMIQEVLRLVQSAAAWACLRRRCCVVVSMPRKSPTA